MNGHNRNPAFDAADLRGLPLLPGGDVPPHAAGRSGDDGGRIVDLAAGGCSRLVQRLGAHAARADERVMFVVRFEPQARCANPMVALRHVLKYALRVCGLRCVSVVEESPCQTSSEVAMR